MGTLARGVALVVRHYSLARLSIRKCGNEGITGYVDSIAIHSGYIYIYMLYMYVNIWNQTKPLPSKEYRRTSSRSHFLYL